MVAVNSNIAVDASEAAGQCAREQLAEISQGKGLILALETAFIDGALWMQECVKDKLAGMGEQDQ